MTDALAVYRFLIGETKVKQRNSSLKKKHAVDRDGWLRLHPVA
jgi:hypothetical protein